MLHCAVSFKSLLSNFGSFVVVSKMDKFRQFFWFYPFSYFVLLIIFLALLARLGGPVVLHSNYLFFNRIHIWIFLAVFRRHLQGKRNLIYAFLLCLYIYINLDEKWEIVVWCFFLQNFSQSINRQHHQRL